MGEEHLMQDSSLKKKEQKQEVWITLHEILSVFPKFVRFFQSNWIILAQTIFTVILGTLEITFYLINDQYKNRPVSIYSRVFTPILTLIGVIIIVYSARLFFKKCVEKTDEIINYLNIEFKFEKKVKVPQKSYRKLRFRITMIITLIPLVIILIFISISISSLIQKGTGFYYPDIVISYFMILIKEIYYGFSIIIFTYNIALVSFGIGCLNSFAESLDISKLTLKPTSKDKTGGFREIGKIVRNISLIFVIIVMVQTIISIIEKTVQLIITESYILIQEDIFVTNSQFEYLALVFLTIILIFIILYILYVGLKPYNTLIKYYKNRKLKSLYESKNNLVNKIFEKDSNLKITNKDYNELQKCDYLINEVESIDNWPLSLSRILVIFSSGMLPAIITLVFKIIEIFVL